MTMILVPLVDAEAYDVDWQDLSTMKVVRCRNHPTSKYLTKNPWSRNLHLVEYPVEYPTQECPCPFSQLAVEVDDTKFDPEMAAYLAAADEATT